MTRPVEGPPVARVAPAAMDCRAALADLEGVAAWPILLERQGLNRPRAERAATAATGAPAPMAATEAMAVLR